MVASGVEWLVEAGEITEEEGQRLLEFHSRSASKRLPDLATARQRHVGAELNLHYRKAPDTPVPLHSQFLVAMNIYMQLGISRLKAEERIVTFMRQTHPDFTPLRQ
jgi:hypothetical protein